MHAIIKAKCSPMKYSCEKVCGFFFLYTLKKNGKQKPKQLKQRNKNKFLPLYSTPNYKVE